MKLVAGLFCLTAGLIVAVWWWLGRPVAVTVTPFAAGGKIECLSYAPFRDRQTPIELTTHIEPWQIEEDLRKLAAITDCVRTYSVHQGLDQVVPIAQRLGLKVLVGIWLGRDPEFNRTQLAAAVDLINRYPGAIRAAVVGNEVLLRGELSPVTLGETIRAVKRQVSVPVTYADVWEFWLRNPELLEAVDFVTIHILPYWEDIPIAADIAADHVMSIRRQVGAAFAGKEILIGEVGWPSAGRMREGALPSPSNQARVLREVVARARAENYRLNLIEAFDQPWKRRFEGTVGGHWGLFDATARAPKFAWDQPVSDHPLWGCNAIAGVLLAMLVFGGGIVGQNRRLAGVPSSKIWIGVTVVAAGAGVLLGLTIEQALVESFGPGGLLRSIALATAAIVAPVTVGAALTAGIPAPAFARVLGRRVGWPADALMHAVGLVLAAVTLLAIQAALGLVFDPRYRDFPAAALSAAILPCVLLTGARPFAAVTRPLAETLAAAVLAVCAVYITINETMANWQALWLAVALLALGVSLVRPRAAPG